MFAETNRLDTAVPIGLTLSKFYWSALNPRKRILYSIESMGDKLTLQVNFKKLKLTYDS